MKRAGFAGLVVGLGLASCVEPGTALRLSVSSDEPLIALRLSLQPDTGEPPVIYRLPAEGSAPSLPGVLVLRLADADAELAVLLSGDTSDGRTFTGQGAVHCAAQAVCALSVRLAQPRSFTGASCDHATRCASGFCVGGVCCDQACDGGCGVCAVADGATSDGTCTLRAKDVICRKSAGVCDLGDRCDGKSSACPDLRVSMGTVCRAAVAACDIAELCDGLAADCPSNASVCTAGNYCATTGGCMATKPQGAACSDPTQCSSGFCAPGGVCCDTACTGACESCVPGPNTGDGGVCHAVTTGTFPGGSVICRASTGVCDPAEACDGMSRSCPADQKSTLISTIIDLDESGTGSVTSTGSVASAPLTVGCAGGPPPAPISRVFLTFHALALPPGATPTSVQLHGCVTSGTIDASAGSTTFALPLDTTAYNAMVTSSTLLPSSNGAVHDEITSLPVTSVSSKVETQLQLRAVGESCGIMPTQRVYASGPNAQCTTSVFQLIVNRCAP